ncbi:MAG: putative flagellar biosynthetic protein fliP [Microvirga sp.]|jgi:flagellar biosynthetic protein FliP|nr:putative flagellar biosynthetic protein fliP [Microvirga sp.]
MKRYLLTGLLLVPAAAGASALDNLSQAGMSSPVNTFVVLTTLAFIPIFLVGVTTFTRNIVVLSLLRQAIGLQQTPPNVVLITLSIFLTLFVMSPTLQRSYESGVEPYLANKLSLEKAMPKAWAPLRDFMVRQTREADLILVHELARAPLPKTVSDLSPMRLVPAFMLSELKIAFQIGLAVFLPFLIIDLVVASILMSLGMIMVPPATISLPLKIMLFLLIDGWGLIAQALVRSVG